MVHWLLMSVLLLTPSGCQLKPRPTGASGPDIGTARDELQGHYEAALTELDGAHFADRVDIDLVAAQRHCDALHQGAGGVVTWQARASLVQARIEALSGRYRRAVHYGQRALPGLAPQEAAELQALLPFWERWQYRQADLLLDNQDALDGGAQPQMEAPAASARPSLVEAAHAMARREDLLNAVQLLPSDWRMTDMVPLYDEVSQRLDLTHCGEPISARRCLIADLRRILPLSSIGRMDDAKGLALATAALLRKRGDRTLSAYAQLLGGDVLITHRASPLELNLPLLSSKASLTADAGLTPEPFMAIAEDRILAAEALYDQVQQEVSLDDQPRLAAELAARRGYVAHLRGDYLRAARAFAEASQRARSARDFRTALRAASVGWACAVAAHTPLSEYTQTLDALLNDQPDPGLRIGTARLLSLFANLLLHTRSDFNAAWTLQEKAADCLKRISSPRRLAAVQMQQAELLLALGQSRSAIPYLSRAVDWFKDADDKPDGSAKATSLRALGALNQVCSTLLDSACLRWTNDQMHHLLPESMGGQYTTYAKAMNAMVKGGIAILEGDFQAALELCPPQDLPSPPTAAQAATPQARQQLVQPLVTLTGIGVTRAGALLAMGRKEEAVDSLGPLVTHLVHVLSATSPLDPSSSEDLVLRYGLANLTASLLDVLLVAGAAQEAEVLLNATEALAGPRFGFEDPAKPWAYAYVRARIADGLERYDEAKAQYDAMDEAVRRRAKQLSARYSQTNFHAAILRPAQERIAFLLRRGWVNEGLIAMEDHHASELQTALLSLTMLRGPDSELHRSWLQAIGHLGSLEYRATPGGSTGNEGINPEALDVARANLAEREAALLGKLLSSSDLERGAVDVLIRSQDRLKRDNASLVLYVPDVHHSVAIVLRPGRPPDVRALDVPANFAQQVDSFEADLTSPVEGWRSRGQVLYAQLIAPIADLLPPTAGKQRPLVGIVPLGQFQPVPFHALPSPSAGKLLVEHYDFFYAPSLLTYAMEPDSPPEPTVLFRALGYNGGLLRNAENEALSIDPHASTGGSATQAALERTLAAPGAVLVSAHAEIDSQNPFSSFIRLADRDVTLFDLLGIDMQASLVTLSACETGVGGQTLVDQRNDLATVFLRKGAKAVVATRWPVDDRLALPLMQRFFDNMRQGTAPARALGDAQRQALRGPFAGRHPAFWAAYSLFGSPR